MSHSKLALTLFAFSIAAAAAPGIQTVHFPSADGQTKLVGYVFAPSSSGRHPAVVMLHGRSGPYSSLAKGNYSAETLSKRHKEWGNFWAERGYVAILVDSFGPRGYASGFAAGSYKDRPEAVSEQTVRPLDAYGALRYLRTRKDVIPDRIGLQGWSNGAMTTLVTMSSKAPGIENPTSETGFRMALAEYPGCGMEAVSGKYVPYAHVEILIGSADAEVSPKICESFAQRAKRNSADLNFTLFPGAEHNYDDPSKAKQANAADRAATEETMRRAETLFRDALQH